MGLKPFLLALRAKGPADVSKRMWAIASRYGVGSSKMLGHLEMLFGIVEGNEARATLPVTASAAARHPELVKDLGDRGIEFAVHGYDHIDHRSLTRDQQITALDKGRRTLEAVGITSSGFRAPYLRWSDETLAAVAATGFEYDSSQAFHWPVPNMVTNEGYARVLEFCYSLPAEPRAIRPWTERGMLRIPYALPDDEALVERLKITDPDAVADVWLAIWKLAHERGDLFALGIHPERIGICGPGVDRVLRTARAAEDRVWIATLDEISNWWRARSKTSLEVSQSQDGEIVIRVHSAPEQARLLARGLPIQGGTAKDGGFVILAGDHHRYRSDVLPVVGVDPSSPSSLSEFISEEGFVIESNPTATTAVEIRRDEFSPEDEQDVLREILSGDKPLIRLSRWPLAARSALAITGDVDAFTLWDYASRLAIR